MPRDSTATLDAHLGEWEGAGLLTHDQAMAIHDFEVARPVAATRRYRRLVAIVAVFAVLLIGFGVIQVVASNWEAVPDAGKLVMLVVAVIGFEAAGWRLYRAETSPGIGVALILAGYLLYGAGIHLVAQTYNRPLDDPSLLLWWFLPALPLAHLARSGIIAVAGIAVGYAALGIRLGEWLEDADVGLAWAAPYMGIAAVLLAIGLWRREREGPAAGYGFAGGATALGLLYVGGFRLPTGSDVVPEVLVVLAIASATALAIVAIHRVAVDAAVVGALLAFAWFWALDTGVQWQVAYAVTNLALLAAIVGIVALGLLRREEVLVNVGVAVFALAVLTRYVEIGAGMLGTGLSYIGTGIVLLAFAAGLERARRTLVARIEEVDDEA